MSNFSTSDAVRTSEEVSEEVVVRTIGFTYIRRETKNGSIAIRAELPDGSTVERMGKKQGEDVFPSFEAFKAYCRELAKAGIIDWLDEEQGQPALSFSEKAQQSFDNIIKYPWVPSSELLKNRPPVSF